LQDKIENIKLKTNREYKDSVFTTLFNDPEKMLELYNAINKTSYKDISKIHVRTLTDVLYKVLKNDIAFTYDDKGSKILSECSTLNQYSYFVDKIRKLIDSGYSRDEAIQKSIEDCVNENILKDFLIQHGREVCNMLYAEYDIEEALKAKKEDTKIEAVKRALHRGKLTIQEIAEDNDLPLEVVREIAKEIMKIK